MITARLIKFLWIVYRILRFWHTITGPDGMPYLRRFRIFNNRFFGVFVHQILRSDIDRHCHDHPWNFVSVILKGKYREFNLRSVCDEDGKPTGEHALELKTYRAGDIVSHIAEDAHRLEIPEGTTTWTLVFCGRTRREWGFWVGKDWLHWKPYLAWKYGSNAEAEQ